MEWIIKKIDVEVEELVHTYKRGTSELKTSLGKIQDTAKKSIGDISNLTKSNQTFPRIWYGLISEIYYNCKEPSASSEAWTWKSKDCNLTAADLNNSAYEEE